MSFSASKETNVAVGQVEFPKMGAMGRPTTREPADSLLNLGATGDYLE